MSAYQLRAWDGERLWLVNALGWVDGEVDRIDTSKYHGAVEHDIVLMQDTGLRDSCNTPIFEGDIVENHCQVRFEIRFGLFVHAHTQEGPQVGFYELHANGLTYPYIANELNEDRVLGNIYEHPALSPNTSTATPIQKG